MSEPSNVPSRWATLTAKYGLLGAIRPYFLGERPPKVSEREPKLAWYVQWLVYATSLATLFVFGISEIYLILHYGWSVISTILGIPLGLLLIMVYAMDRSFARTIPRIGMLAQRRQYGLLIEHIAYVVCVGAIEAFTYGLVIYTMENNINALLHGQSIIPTGIGWLLGLIAARAVLLIWTIGHAHLTSEDLQVQWGTIERQGIELLGGNVLQQVEGIDLQQTTLGQKMRLLMLFLRPVARAPWSWNRRERQAAQAALDEEHRQEIVDAFIEMEAPRHAEVIITPVPSTNGHHVATEPVLALPEVTEEPFVAEMANSVASPQGNPQRPKPGTKRFNMLVYSTAKKLVADGRYSIFNVAKVLQIEADEAQAALQALQQARLDNLRSDSDLAPDPVLDLLTV